MLKTTFLTLFVIFTCIHYSWADSNSGSIHGKIIDGKTNEPVSYASIALKKIDGTYTTGVISADDGSFTIQNVVFGSYMIEISFVGYIPHKMDISLNETTLELGEIRLQNAVMQMDEVVIVGTASKESANIEKTTINTSRSMSAATGSILDVLRASSSVSVDNEGAVSIRGNNHILILINGVPTTIDALGSIPASVSKSIEIITSPDVKYDSEGTGGIINIITKSNEGSGYNGMAQFNYGFTNRLNGALALNYTSEKIGFGLTYNGKYEKNESASTLHRLFHSSGNTINQEIRSFQKDINHVVGLNFIYRMSPKDKLTVEGRTLFPENSNNQFLTVTSSQTGDVRNRENRTIFNRKVFEGTVGYERVIVPEKSTLSLMTTISKTQGSRPAEYFEDNEFIQYSKGGGEPLHFNAQVDYNHLLTKNTTLEGGLKYSLRSNYFKYDSWIYDSGTGSWDHSDFFSSDLKHQESIIAGYLSMASRFGKVGYKIGARVEYSDSQLESKIAATDNFSSDNLFLSPYFYLNVPVNDNNKFELTVSRRITRPTYPQLNPFINMIDAATYETGNRYLKPEITNKFDLGYSLSANSFRLQSTLYYNYSKDYIAQTSSLYDDDALMISYMNGTDSRTGLDMFASYTIMPQITWSMAVNGFYGESKYSSQTLSGVNSGWTLIGNTAVTVKPMRNTEIEVRYFFNSRQYFPQFTVDGYNYLNVGVKQNFAKNRLTASILLTDVLNTSEWNIKSDNQIYRLKNFNKETSRILWIGLTYRINAYKPSQPKQSQESDRGVIRLGQ